MKRYRVRKAPDTRDTTVDWTRAEPLTDFVFPWETTEPPFTEFRALWTDERLLFRFECLDADLVLAEGDTATERVLGSDRVEIFVAPDLGLDPYYGFEMEPRGEVHAYRARHYRRFEPEWKHRALSFAGSVTKDGYTVEGSLTFGALREMGVLKPGAGEFFAGVYRAEFSREPDGGVHQGWMPWVNPRTTEADFHVPESFGVFELVG